MGRKLSPREMRLAATLTVAAILGCGPALAAKPSGPGSTMSKVTPPGPELAWVAHMSGPVTVDDIDNSVLAVMKASGVRGASIAIVNGTRLVYAKGYSWGPPGTPAVEPTTYFRQASVSKFVTALAVMQLVQDNKLALNQYAQDYLKAKTGTSQHNDDNWDITTIENLLEMDTCEPPLFGADAYVAGQLGKGLPINRTDILTYLVRQHDSTCYPGKKSLAYYNNTDYAVLGYVVAKIGGKSTEIDAIKDSLLKPFAITRIRDARELKSDQLPDEATYYPDTPGAKAPNVMGSGPAQVEVGYGDTNLGNFEGAGGLSAAATDIARLVAGLSLKSNPSYNGATIKNWPDIVASTLNLSYESFQDPGYTHKDSNGNSDAFGFYGFDSVSRSGPVKSPQYSGDKGGYLDSSQNAIFFQTGGIGYVICWNGHTTGGENWYPVFQSVLTTASSHNWGSADLFPTYGMPSFTASYILQTHPVVGLKVRDLRVLGPKHPPKN